MTQVLLMPVDGSCESNQGLGAGAGEHVGSSTEGGLGEPFLFLFVTPDEFSFLFHAQLIHSDR